MTATAPPGSSKKPTAPAPRASDVGEVSAEPVDAHRIDVYALLRGLGEDDSVQLVWKPSAKGMILLVFSEKGGVGKTALTNGLATSLGVAGFKVLVIDLDPRATATAELGVRVSKDDLGVNDLLFTDPTDADPADPYGLASEAIRPSSEAWPETIHVIAAERGLGLREFDNTPGMETRLRMALQGVAEQYDLVLIDVPPRPGGKLVAAAIQAGTHALLPATLDEDGFVGVRDAVLSMRRSRRNFGQPPLKIVGVIRNIVDRRRNGITTLYDAKLAEEWPADSNERCGACEEPVCPHVPRLIEAIAIPKYVVRQESRSAEVPFTDAGTQESEMLRRAYTRLLNCIAEAA